MNLVRLTADVSLRGVHLRQGDLLEVKAKRDGGSKLVLWLPAWEKPYSVIVPSALTRPVAHR